MTYTFHIFQIEQNWLHFYKYWVFGSHGKKKLSHDIFDAWKISGKSLFISYLQRNRFSFRFYWVFELNLKYRAFGEENKDTRGKKNAKTWWRISNDAVASPPWRFTCILFLFIEPPPTANYSSEFHQKIPHVIKKTKINKTQTRQLHSPPRSGINGIQEVNLKWAFAHSPSVAESTKANVSESFRISCDVMEI